MKVTLREMDPSDIPVFFNQQNDREAHDLVGITSHAPDDEIAFNQKCERILAGTTVTIQTIVCDGEIAGNIRCFFAPWSEKQEIGYWLGREFWGRGIATYAVAEFLKVEKQRPLFATVAAHNKASLSILKKCGFEQIAEETVKLENDREIQEIRLILEG